MKLLVVLCPALSACSAPPEDGANPMTGRLAISYGIGKDGESLWQCRADLGVLDLKT